EGRGKLAAVVAAERQDEVAFRQGMLCLAEDGNVDRFIRLVGGASEGQKDGQFRPGGRCRPGRGDEEERWEQEEGVPAAEVWHGSLQVGASSEGDRRSEPCFPSCR